MKLERNFLILTLLLMVAAITDCWEVTHVTLPEGGTLVLRCPRENPDNSIEWRDPHDGILFFNDLKAMRNLRTSFVTLSHQEFTILMSRVTFRDEGNYTCREYNDKIKRTIFNVNVIGRPKIQKTMGENDIIVRCTSAASEEVSLPELSWQMGGSGIEIEASSNKIKQRKSKRQYVVSVLKVRSHVRKATLKCLAKHQGFSQILEDFITIKNNTIKASTTKNYSKTKQFTTVAVTANTSPSGSASTAQTELPSVSEHSQALPARESTTLNDEYSNGTDVNLTTKNTLSNATEAALDKNSTVPGSSLKDSVHGKYSRETENSPLLVVLVTSLILCLLIVVVFFLIKLKKAHRAWKRENEESDQSVESNKSKSSHEEKQSKERRKQGFWNSNFTQYKTEESPESIAAAVPTVDVVTETKSCSKPVEGVTVRETEL